MVVKQAYMCPLGKV